MWRMNRPLILSILVVVVPYFLAIYIHYQLANHNLFSVSGSYLLFFSLGYMYMHFFEWFFHHGPMHHRSKIWPRAILKSHMVHHRVFVDENFQTRDIESLQNITTAHHIFPALFAIHYCLFVVFAPAHFAPMFFLGIVIHFLIYEISHWCTHVKDNLADKIISHIPLLNWLRRRQIDHHFIHHQQPVYNFNFTPPYLFDSFAHTKKQPR